MVHYPYQVIKIYFCSFIVNFDFKYNCILIFKIFKCIFSKILNSIELILTVSFPEHPFKLRNTKIFITCNINMYIHSFRLKKNCAILNCSLLLKKIHL